MIDTNLLKLKIDEKGLKRYYIADKMGISVQALQLKVDGVREFKASEIRIISRLLGLELKEIDKIFLIQKVWNNVQS